MTPNNLTSRIVCRASGPVRARADDEPSYYSRFFLFHYSSLQSTQFSLRTVQIARKAILQKNSIEPFLRFFSSSKKMRPE